MSGRFENRHSLIWHREQLFGYELARILIPKPVISVWMLMLPFLFLFFIQDIKKYKAGIRGFVDGFLKNKKIALDLAFKALQEEASLDRVMADFATDSRPESAAHIDLFEKQLRETACLASHYHRLMQAGGDSFETLVRQACGSAANYHQFLDRLFGLEDAVLEAAFKLQEPGEEARALAGKMRTAGRRIRREAGDRIFQG